MIGLVCGWYLSKDNVFILSSPLRVFIFPPTLARGEFHVLEFSRRRPLPILAPQANVVHPDPVSARCDATAEGFSRLSTGHLNILSSLCDSTCDFSADAVLNVLSQPSTAHVCGRSAVCTNAWVRNTALV